VVFVNVVEAGSLTAAAARLGLAKAMVTAHMQRLEHEVGASLLVRTTRRLSLTEAGEAFFEASRRIVHDAEAAVVAAAESTSEPKGTLRVTAPIDYGATVVAPVSVALQRRFPDLKIELMAGDRVFDLAADGIDLAIRIGQLADSGHQATRIGSFADCLVASPALFGTAGLPQQPDDLDALPFIALSVLPNPVSWPMTHVQGELRQQRFKATLSANTAYAVRMAALAGGGLGILPDFAIEQDLAAGRLVRVLPQWRLPAGGIHAVFPATRTPPKKVRVLIDALRAHVERALELPLGSRPLAPA
jgi:DNA-binding transcriptional LysR family regulator